MKKCKHGDSSSVEVLFFKFYIVSVTVNYAHSLFFKQPNSKRIFVGALVVQGKVKLPLYSLGQALKFPGVSGSQISRKLAH